MFGSVYSCDFLFSYRFLKSTVLVFKCLKSKVKMDNLLKDPNFVEECHKICKTQLIFSCLLGRFHEETNNDREIFINTDEKMKIFDELIAEVCDDKSKPNIKPKKNRKFNGNMTSRRGSDGTITCEWCLQTYTNKRSYEKRHKYKKQGDKCCICQENFNKSEIEEHIEEFASKMCCCKCNRHFTDKKKFNKHRAHHRFEKK